MARKPKYVASTVFPADTPLQAHTDWLRTHLILHEGVHYPEIDRLRVIAERQLHLFDDDYTITFRVFEEAPRTTSLNAER